MHLQKIPFLDFNPDLTLLGGQAFNWAKEGDFYYGIFSDRVLKVKYDGKELIWASSREKDEEFVKALFDTEFDYDAMICEITKDKAVKKAVEEFPGLRILKQPFEQTLISFVISQNSNIPKIKRSLQLLSKSVGRKISFDGRNFYLFPEMKELASFSIEQLQSTGIGYRAKYIKQICEELTIACHPGFSEVERKKIPGSRKSSRLHLAKARPRPSAIASAGVTLEDSRKKLLSLHGIGPKVADCILVFGLGARSLTPIDLWARRAFVTTYGLSEKICYKDLQIFINQKFGENTAYAGQFLFEYFRLHKIK